MNKNSLVVVTALALSLPAFAADGSYALTNAPRVGCIAWLDLTVPDVSAACDFYQRVVGWSVQDVEGTDTGERSTAYQMCGSDGRPVAGVCHDRAGSRTPSAIWMIYLPVDDLAESLRRVKEEGGTIVESVRGPEGEYGRAVVQDPVEVCFGLVQDERRPNNRMQRSDGAGPH